MAVYYKFKSAKDYDSVPLDGPFISVGTLKEKVFESKRLGKGTDHDLVITNAQTNEEYTNEEMLIPKNTSVLVQRVPGRPRMAIVTQQEQMVQINVENTQPESSSLFTADLSSAKYTEDVEPWDEFGNDLYAITDAPPVQPNRPLTDALSISKADEDNNIKALIDTPALDWQRQGVQSFGGRGYGRGMAGRMGGRGFGGFDSKNPPEGYVCHRCAVPGHFIHNCPTNGDSSYNVKRMRPPTGIPKSMLMPTPDGSYALPSGAVAVLKPNEDVFEKAIEGLPSSSRSIIDIPPELLCPLCNEVMKDAVLTSRCCFKSFCQQCIRDQITSKSICVCARNVLADDLLPNMTLRDTISRILEHGGNSSGENSRSTFQVPDTESRIPQPKIPSPINSIGFKGEENPLRAEQETTNVTEMVELVKPVNSHQIAMDEATTSKAQDVSQATLESTSMKEPSSQRLGQRAEEEEQQKPIAGDAGKKKKKKVRAPPNDLQWRAPQDLAADAFMMPSAYNPYWNGMQPMMDGYMGPFSGGMMQPGMEGYNGPFAGGMPFMGPTPYNPYMDVPFRGVMPQVPFGAQGFMMPNFPPQRELANNGMAGGMNMAPPAMSREEFEARKANLKWQRENETNGIRKEFSRDREVNREAGSGSITKTSGGDVSSMKSKTNLSTREPQSHRLDRPERTCSPQPNRSSKKRAGGGYSDDLEIDKNKDRERRHRDRDRDHHHQPHPSSSDVSRKHQSEIGLDDDRKNKASVFSRIHLPGGEKHKISSSKEVAATNHHKNGFFHDDRRRSSNSYIAADHESSDDDRHFKRRRSRYEPSPPPPPPPSRELEDHSRYLRQPRSER